MKKPLLLIIMAAGVFSFSMQALAADGITSPDNPLMLATPVDVVPENQKPDWMQYKDTYAGEQNDLSNPNRTNEEILTWVQETATESLTFDPESMNAILTAQKPAFMAQGWAQYVQYLNDTKLVDMIRKQNYSVTTIVDGTPRLINNMPAGGTYHWLVEAPLLMTFTKYDATTQEAKPAGGSRFTLTMQLGRTAKGGKDGLVVESWKTVQKQ